MKRLLFLVMLVVGAQAAVAQSIVLDSLYRELEKFPDGDSNRVNLLISVCYREYTSLPEQNKLHANEALAISDRIAFKKGSCLATKYIGLYYWSVGDYEHAMSDAYTMLDIAEESDYLKGKAAAYQLLGLVSESREDFANAEKYYLEALSAFRSTGSTVNVAYVYNSLGTLNFNSQKLDLALMYYSKAMELRKEMNDEDGLSQSYSNIAQVYSPQGKYKDALTYFFKALTIMEKLDNKYRMAATYEGMGTTYIRLGDKKNGERILRKAIGIANELRQRKILQICYGDLAELKKEQNNFKAALNYYSIAAAYGDTISSEERDRKIAEMQARYETSKKDQLIQSLEQEKYMHTMWTRLLIATLIIVVVLSATLYSFQRLNERKNRHILDLRIDQLTNQTRELTARYQNVLTPDDKTVDSQDKRLLQKAIEVVESNIADPTFSVDSMAKALGMSRSNLHKKLKSITGFPPNELIRSIRLRKAAILLRGRADSISQISISVGFDDHSYFSRSFKKQFGVSPSEYQDTHPA